MITNIEKSWDESPPASYARWESALTHRFLMVGESGDASPIRSFGITPETLADAVGLSGVRAEHSAIASFKTNVCGVGLRDALEHGFYSRLAVTDNQPGYFCYLALTLLVASQRDEDMRLGGDFHEKLRKFLGVSSGYRALPGVAKMWRSLALWLDARHSRGLPFRRLILPPYPPTWVHIGFTRKLAFPAKSDAILLTNFFSSHPDVIHQPLAFIRRFEPFLAHGRGSDGMVESFGDFKTSFLTGDRFLAEHPFWRLAQACSPVSEMPGKYEGEIECTFDEDGTPCFSAFRADGSKITTGPVTLANAVATMGRGGEAGLPTLRRGFLVFRQTGYGRWRSVPGLDGISGQVRLGCSAESHLRLREHRSLFAPTGSWYFTSKPVSSAIADDCASLVGASELSEGRLSAVTVFGGVRTTGHWLGRPSFLPRIAAGSLPLKVRPGNGARGDLKVRYDAYAPGSARLLADKPVAGPWFIEPEEGRFWSRRVTFSADAFVHATLDSPAYGFTELKEWQSLTFAPVACECAPKGWEACTSRMADLVEAVYAGGQSGWDEADLVALIQDAFGKRGSAWAVLRTLRDAMIIQPRLRPLWKGRVWTLRRPALRQVGDLALVEGALCERMAEEFHTAGESLGYEVFRKFAQEITAPPLIGCKGGDFGILAHRLGWDLLNGNACGEGRLSFVETPLRLIGRKAASRWDWHARRFVADGREGDGEVRLTRWAQAGGADHDIYTVERSRDRKQHRLLSRGAAVALAHSLAGVPLFAAADGYLVGVAQEAYLPDAVAAQLRLRHASNPGVCEGSYVYEADAKDLAWLDRLLPGLVARNQGTHPRFGADAISSARHSRGRMRLAWNGGNLAAVEAAVTVVGER